MWARQFMYECVMGLKKVEGNGVILADEMYVPHPPLSPPTFRWGQREMLTVRLGVVGVWERRCRALRWCGRCSSRTPTQTQTIQECTFTLPSSCLTSPLRRRKPGPDTLLGLLEHRVGKILIVCPVSLTTNWNKEFRKWCVSPFFGIGLCPRLTLIILDVSF